MGVGYVSFKRLFSGKLSLSLAGLEYCSGFYCEKLLKHDILLKFVLCVNVFKLKNIARIAVSFIKILILKQTLIIDI